MKSAPCSGWPGTSPIDCATCTHQNSSVCMPVAAAFRIHISFSFRRQKAMRSTDFSTSSRNFRRPLTTSRCSRRALLSLQRQRKFVQTTESSGTRSPLLSLGVRYVAYDADIGNSDQAAAGDHRLQCGDHLVDFFLFV